MNNYNPVSGFQTFMLNHEDELKQWDNLDDNLNLDLDLEESFNHDKNEEFDSPMIETIENLIDEMSPQKNLDKFINLMGQALNNTTSIYSEEINATFKTDTNTIDHSLENNKTYLNNKLV
jgi:hypothetical protein